MKKVKVAHILHAVGGVDIHLRLLFRNLDPSKFENVIIHGKTDTNHQYFDKHKKEIKGYKVSIDRDISVKDDFKAFSEIKKIVKAEKPDLLHGHSAKGGILAKIVGQHLKIPVLHTPHAYSFLSAENPLKKKIFLQIEKFFSQFNSKIVACSNSERNRAIHDIGYKPENALLFNNSIEPIDEVANLGIPKTWPEKYICSVGRPSYQKNIEMMVEVIRKVTQEKPDVHLILMGVGFHAPNLEKVKDLIVNYQLQENITLLEWTKREDILNIIKNSQCYISTARYEGLPYSIIEAMALKKAIVATDADGNKDLIENGKNGFLVQNENIIDFSNKVLKLLGNDELRKQFEANSFEKFSKNFNIHQTIKILEKIYLENAKPQQK